DFPLRGVFRRLSQFHQAAWQSPYIFRNFPFFQKQAPFFVHNHRDCAHENEWQITDDCTKYYYISHFQNSLSFNINSSIQKPSYPRILFLNPHTAMPKITTVYAITHSIGVKTSL